MRLRILRALTLGIPLFAPATATASFQQPASASLVFDNVTVVDVEHGTLVPDQRVVIVGSRIRTVGGARSAPIPTGAKVIDARGKYLIPGLWDMHVHPRHLAPLAYPLFVANGVTGIRDAGSPVPLDTLRRWRQEILAGTRVGPPRQLLSGQSIAGPQAGCIRGKWPEFKGPQTCVTDVADARRYVDSLKAAGADMIKPRDLRSDEMYYAIAAEARRLRLPFGGHGPGNLLRFSDSGAAIVDHAPLSDGGGVFKARGCRKRPNDAAVLAQCRLEAEHFRRNGTWFVPTQAIWSPLGPVYARILTERGREFWNGKPLRGNWLRDSTALAADSSADSAGVMLYLAQQVGLPILAGTDVGANTMRSAPSGFALHAELAMQVAEGLTPLNSLQSATLNPAKMLHATDSLGTVAPGKLADLILLNANPLTDITNTTTIHGVVANGRYFDRTALDQLLLEVQAKAADHGLKGSP